MKNMPPAARTAFAVALASNDPPMVTYWVRIQVLFSSRPETLLVLFGLAVAVVAPTFLWFHVSFLWVKVLWLEYRAGKTPMAL